MMKRRTAQAHLASALITLITAAVFARDANPGESASRPVKVFILAGQSNMEGKAKVALLEHQLAQPETREQFRHLKDDGKWIERDET